MSENFRGGGIFLPRAVDKALRVSKHPPGRRLVRSHSSWQNYFRQTAKFGEDINPFLSYYKGKIFSTVFMTLNLTMTFENDSEIWHRCWISVHKKWTFTFREITTSVMNAQTNQPTNEPWTNKHVWSQYLPAEVIIVNNCCIPKISNKNAIM